MHTHGTEHKKWKWSHKKTMWKLLSWCMPIDMGQKGGGGGRNTSVQINPLRNLCCNVKTSKFVSAAELWSHLYAACKILICYIFILHFHLEGVRLVHYRNEVHHMHGDNLLDSTLSRTLWEHAFEVYLHQEFCRICNQRLRIKVLGLQSISLDSRFQRRLAIRMYKQRGWKLGKYKTFHSYCKQALLMNS